ncbi:MAG: hypothetical protein SGPRY_008927 [Prymnesium sp.]
MFGHDFVGLRLARKFGKKIVLGKIDRWLPAGGKGEPALFQMVHDDADEETLEIEEVELARALYAVQPEARRLAKAEEKAQRSAAKQKEKEAAKRARTLAKEDAMIERATAKAKRALENGPTSTRGPRKPHDAEFYYLRDKRATMAAAHPLVSRLHINNMLSAEFRELSGEAREPYAVMAARDQARYEAECKCLGIDPNVKRPSGSATNIGKKRVHTTDSCPGSRPTPLDLKEESAPAKKPKSQNVLELIQSAPTKTPSALEYMHAANRLQVALRCQHCPLSPPFCSTLTTRLYHEPADALLL